MKELVILLLLLAQPATGMYTLEVTEYGYAIITQEIEFHSSSPADTFTYYIPFPIDHLEVYSSTPVSGTFIVMGMQTEITLTGNFLPGEPVYCICEYLSWEIISKEGTQWQLSLPVMEESLTVLMPRGTEIVYMVTESDFPSISQNLGVIQLFWERVPHAVSLYYQVPLTHQGSVPWSAMVLAPVTAAVLAGLWIYTRRKKKRLNQSVLSILSDREICIVNYLYAQGTARQAKIARNCDIPKTSLSKILLRMEERGIIQRKRDGTRTYCSLTDAVLE